MAGNRISLEVDDARARAAMRRLIRAVANPAPALDEIGARLVTSTVLRFEREHSPDGVPWKRPRRAERERGQTLTDTGRLRGSITHRVVGDAVEVGTNVVYGAIHQLGGRTPARTIRPKTKKALFFPGAAHPVAKVRHPGSTIPARPFLGLDDGDRRAIERIVERHLAEAVG